jgi:hypothetical protein
MNTDVPQIAGLIDSRPKAEFMGPGLRRDDF